MLAFGLFALVLSAVAMLSVPLAVRRMIDHGFSADNAGFIDQYFGMMIVIGAVLAASIAARFYCVSWLGERVVADLREDVFSHLTRLGPRVLREDHSGEVMSRLTADYHADQGGRRSHHFTGPAQHHHVHRRLRDDVHHEP